MPTDLVDVLTGGGGGGGGTAVVAGGGGGGGGTGLVGGGAGASELVAGGAGFSVSLSVTGQTVVLTGMVTVVRTVLCAGHLVSVGWQLVMVLVVVV